MGKTVTVFGQRNALRKRCRQEDNRKMTKSFASCWPADADTFR